MSVENWRKLLWWIVPTVVQFSGPVLSFEYTGHKAKISNVRHGDWIALKGVSLLQMSR